MWENTKITGLVGLICIILICVSGCTGTPKPGGNPNGGEPGGVQSVVVVVSNSSDANITNASSLNYTVNIKAERKDISTSGNIGWEKYTNEADRFSLSKPSDWRVSDENPDIRNYRFNISAQMLPKVVYLLPSNNEGFITIYGMKAKYPLENITGTYAIPEEVYNSFIEGYLQYQVLNNGYNKSQLAVANDTEYYTINGNPVRRVIVSTISNEPGTSIEYTVYLVYGRGNYYVLEYLPQLNKESGKSETVSTIIKSFTTL